MRIAIVNDLLIAIEALRRVIATVPDYQVVWVARDGAEAVTKAIADPPDLILMDLLMPGVDGVTATRQIMKQSPCAIVLVTATVQGQGAKVFEAMGYGALDAVNTPILGPQGQGESGSEVLAKIATVGKLLGKSGRRKPQDTLGAERRSRSQPVQPVIAIGASTGGPQALRTILSKLPTTFAGTVVIVQHIDAQFAPGLVSWLGQYTPLPVQLVQPGSGLQPKHIYVAGTNDHLILQPDLTFTYTPEPSHYAYHPSIDVLFKSMAAHWPGKGVAALLTGMGKDGASGLLALRTAGWHTIAQNRETCVVYGMPKAAAELEAAVEILPIEAIAAACLNR